MGLPSTASDRVQHFDVVRLGERRTFPCTPRYHLAIHGDGDTTARLPSQPPHQLHDGDSVFYRALFAVQRDLQALHPARSGENRSGMKRCGEKASMFARVSPVTITSAMAEAVIGVSRMPLR